MHIIVYQYLLSLLFIIYHSCSIIHDCHCLQYYHHIYQYNDKYDYIYIYHSLSLSIIHDYPITNHVLLEIHNYPIYIIYYHHFVRDFSHEKNGGSFNVGDQRLLALSWVMTSSGLPGAYGKNVKNRNGRWSQAATPATYIYIFIYVYIYNIIIYICIYIYIYVLEHVE